MHSCILAETWKINFVLCKSEPRVHCLLWAESVLFSSVAQSCLTLCYPMNHSRPGLLVHHQLPEFTQTHVHWVSDAIQPSVISSSFFLQFFPALGSFPISQLFAWGGQSIGASASASVLPMNVQGLFPLGLTGLTSLLSKGLSRVFCSTTVQKHQFFGVSLLYHLAAEL